MPHFLPEPILGYGLSFILDTAEQAESVAGFYEASHRMSRRGRLRDGPERAVRALAQMEAWEDGWMRYRLQQLFLTCLPADTTVS